MNTTEFFEENKRLKKENDLLKLKVENLEFQLSKHLRARFARKSEKDKSNGQLELAIFDEASISAPEKVLDATDEEITVASYKKKSGRKPLPKGLPREQIIHDLPRSAKNCTVCNHELVKIGEVCSEQLEFIPAQIKIIEHVRYKYACKPCESNVVTAPLPKQIIPKSIATPGLLAQTLVSKFQDHLPLYRQEKIWQRHGVDIPRCTLSNWVLKCGASLQPILNIMKKHLLASHYMQCDETTLQVLKEMGKVASSKSYIWVYRTGPPTKEIIIYEYQPNRSGVNASNFLESFSGYLQVDGYAGYEQIMARADITAVYCMAHARRNFIDIVKANKNNKTKAQIGVNYIKKLYNIERNIRDLDNKYKVKIRQEKAKPILDRLKFWLEETYPKCLPKGPLGKAINYMLYRWEGLTVYLTNGYLNIDNNLIENRIRPFAVGRKNWLFAQNKKGAEAAATIYSIIQTATANNLDVYKYLRYLLTKLPDAICDADIDSLLPVNLTNQDLIL